jgi:hypothetical protein
MISGENTPIIYAEVDHQETVVRRDRRDRK